MKIKLALIIAKMLLLDTISVANAMVDAYYWYGDEKIEITIKDDKWFVLFNEKPDLNKVSNELQIAKEKIGKIRPEKDILPEEDYATGKTRYFTYIKAERNEINFNTSIVSYYAPFYEYKGHDLGLTHIFYVKLYEKENIDVLQKLENEHEVQILHQHKIRPKWYTLTVTQRSDRNALEMANLFYEMGNFVAVEPNFLQDRSPNTVNDPKFNDQWNLENTGQYGGTSGSDVQAIKAWEITRSHSNMVTAIVDHGLENDHPDLPNIYEDSYDIDYISSPSQIYGNHGMAVGGIVGADIDNNEGIAGIAPKGYLMSISTSFWVADGQLADGIDFAWQNGADVINNSWGGGSPSTYIDDAINDAVTQGRNGLGSVVVFSSGNLDLGWLPYPSSNVDVIAVGASSMCDERTSPTSCDTENWGSNYGTGLDVVAPGVLIPTTDRQPPAGYNPNQPLHPDFFVGGTILDEDDEYDNENYTIWFHGTSAAAPHVSGIASLVLSINAELTEPEVRGIIASSSEQVGNYTYTPGAGEHPDLPWNEEMGYGRVNAYRALIQTIENHGAVLGKDKDHVRLILENDMSLKEDVALADNSLLTINAAEEAHNGTVTLSAESGMVTIGGQWEGPGSRMDGGMNELAFRLEQKGEATPTPERYRLFQNYPNPFNPETIFQYEIPNESLIRLEIFDITGRLVAVVVDEIQQPGSYKVTWDASNIASGIYIYRLRAGGFVQSRRMTLIK